MTTLSIIIPAYNEERRIGKTLDHISTFLREKNISFEIIVVANNCTDNTIPLLHNLKNTSIPEIIVLDIERGELVGNMKGYAIKVGMESASGEYHLFIDADNATTFSHAIDFIQFIKDGYDVVIGSRYVSGAKVVKRQPVYRVILSRLSNLLIRVVLFINIYDTQCGFKMFSRNASKEIFRRMTVAGWGADLEMLAIAKSLGYKIKEAPVIWEAQDESTVRSHAWWYTLKELFIIRSRVIKGKYKQ